MIKCSGYSEKGIREVQQDRTICFDLAGVCTVLVVTDGMGGVGGGEVAEIALKVSISELIWKMKTFDADSSDEKLQETVLGAIKAASLAVNQEKTAHPEWKEAGTTITLSVVTKKRVFVGWVGDSPAYSYDYVHGLRQLTTSHSYLEELVSKGVKREDLKDQKGLMSVLTRALGYPEHEEADCVSIPIVNQTYVFVCSDGVSNYLSESEIAEVLKPKETCVLSVLPERLVKTAFLNGSDDNLTAALTVAYGVTNLGGIRKTRLISTKKLRRE